MKKWKQAWGYYRALQNECYDLPYVYKKMFNKFGVLLTVACAETWHKR